MDGPRMVKLKSAFEKMLCQLFAEAQVDEAVKEDIQSLFTQLLLKYSIPSKLNELDSLLLRPPSTLYDVTCPNAISNILSSFIAEPASALHEFIDGESKSSRKELSELKAQEKEIDKSLEHYTSEIHKWLEMSEGSLAEIKKQTQ
ncbi:uncharacterized protein NEMAJ01_0919 [Nematocida major]|uniref:uncharacterized protein n=1 Tax=Nematocida major TaxID=1912982 RepID=UPI002008A30E|nr:uncharacterized protein NEMAJ01_0919 [Nematocida major]KAH9386023.1 hypothetical protein NEMAJ01_0919 [Nematocida major]